MSLGPRESEIALTVVPHLCSGRIFTSSTYARTLQTPLVSFIVFAFRCELLRPVRYTRRYSNCLFFISFNLWSLSRLEAEREKRIKNTHT